MNIIGLDVGFARTRPTSGVAHSGNTGLTLDHATADWADRKRALGSGAGALRLAAGNVLELQSVLERAVVLTDDYRIGADDFFAGLLDATPRSQERPPRHALR